MTTAIVAILVFGVLVFIHELGHFAIAKSVGITVHEFAIGMGPKLIHTQKGDTSYSLRLLPIGGYVRMEGEDEKSDAEGSFSRKPVLSRIGVIFAGPFMNFVLALLLFTIIFYSVGSPTTIISSVVEGSPAEVGGIQAGDRILSINGEEINTWEEVTSTIGSSEGTIKITVLRDNDEVDKEIIPIKDEESNRLIIGISTSMEKSLPMALESSFDSVKGVITDIIGFLKGLFTRNVDTGDVMGPVGIINLVGEVSKNGVLDVLYLTAILSVNLGLMNLLPIPALDGSRILFLILEMFRGKPVDQDKEGMIHLIRFGILMSFMLFITWKDILKLFN